MTLQTPTPSVCVSGTLKPFISEIGGGKVEDKTTLQLNYQSVLAVIRNRTEWNRISAFHPSSCEKQTAAAVQRPGTRSGSGSRFMGAYGGGTPTVMMRVLMCDRSAPKIKFPCQHLKAHCGIRDHIFTFSV